MDVYNALSDVVLPVAMTAMYIGLVCLTLFVVYLIITWASESTSMFTDWRTAAFRIHPRVGQQVVWRTGEHRGKKGEVIGEYGTGTVMDVSRDGEMVLVEEEFDGSVMGLDDVILKRREWYRTRTLSVASSGVDTTIDTV